MTCTRLYANACDSTKIAIDGEDGVDDDQDMVKAETAALATKLAKFQNHDLDIFIRELEEFGMACNTETLWREMS